MDNMNIMHQSKEKKKENTWEDGGVIKSKKKKTFYDKNLDILKSSDTTWHLWTAAKQINICSEIQINIDLDKGG